MRTRDPQKQAALLRAALVVCDREGLVNLTVPAIVKEAGLSTGTFYVYFESKEALLEELYLSSKAETYAELLQGLDPTQGVKKNCKLLFANSFRHRHIRRLESRFQEQYYRSNLLGDEARARSQEGLAPVWALLAQGQAEDLIKPDPAPVLFALALAALREAADRAAGLEGPDLDNLQATAVEFCWSALSR